MWKLALRTIERNRSRCLLSAGGVTTAMLVFLLLSASFAGVVEKSLDVYRGSHVWDVAVIDEFVTEEELSQIGKLKGIHMQPGVRIDAAIKGGNIHILGLNEAGSVFQFGNMEGQFPEKNEIMIPKIIADQLHLEIDSNIQVAFTKESEIFYENFEVSGIFLNGTDFMVISIEKARKMHYYDYNAIFIKLTEANIDYVCRKIEDIIQPEKIISYKTFSRAIQDNYRFTKFSMNLASTLVFLVAGIGMFTMMMISVTRRKREIGILKAIGVKSGELFFLFSLESLIVTTIGVTAGIGIAEISIFLLNLTGKLFILKSSAIFKGIILCFGITFLFSLYPLLITKRVSVMDCMRIKGDEVSEGEI
ncbi:MAG: FtsX-like permease family protein [Candidatus Methanofastidiosia archaeon]